MFVVSMKANRGLLVTVAAVGVALAMLLTRCDGVAATSGAVSADLAESLRQQGYAVSADWSDLREITLPATLDGEWAEYNRLQQAAGYDLSPYLGQRVKRYTYTAQNPAAPTTVTVYVAGGQVIAGDVTVNGEQRGLGPQKQGETDGTTG